MARFAGKLFGWLVGKLLVSSKRCEQTNAPNSPYDSTLVQGLLRSYGQRRGGAALDAVVVLVPSPVNTLRIGPSKPP